MTRNKHKVKFDWGTGRTKLGAYVLYDTIEHHVCFRGHKAEANKTLDSLNKEYGFQRMVMVTVAEARLMPTVTNKHYIGHG